MATDTPEQSPSKSNRKGSKRRTSPAPAVPAMATIKGALEEIVRGNFTLRVDPSALEGDAAVIGELLNLAMERVTAEQRAAAHRREEMSHMLEAAQQALGALVTRGDITAFTPTPVQDPVIDALLDGFSRVIETLRSFVRGINEAALRLSSSANEVLAASTQHESSSTEQAAAIHETTATMEELKHASAQIAENAGAVARVAEETLNSARSGRGAIGEFIQAMQQIRADGVAVSESITKLLRRVERIGTVVEVIDEIADRSDLLALNAALEGSRAGEAGKGFSIVAAEMRRLAENVLDSTKEIKNLITEIREATAAAASAAEASRTATDTGERLGSVAAGAVEGILAGVQETSDAARVINLATQQQRTATEQVVASMGEIEDVTRQTTQASKQATAAAAELTQLASRLSDLIRRFKAD